MKSLYAFASLAMLLSLIPALKCLASSSEAAPPFPRSIPVPVYGVTLDSVSNLNAIVDSLGSLSHMPTARIVFDEYVPASEYVDAIDKIHGVSYVMGELLDSFYMKQHSVNSYLQRTTEYLDAFSDRVDLWEIGNEINGDWLGKSADTAAKMTGAYDLVKSRGGKTALTFYYNEGCNDKPEFDMFNWASKYVPASMKSGLDYVWVSYYEDDCNGLQPDWNAVFEKLSTMFPNSKVGIGECGTRRKARKPEFIQRYYRDVQGTVATKLQAPNFVGGYFWWYFKQDMVPRTKRVNNVSLWDTLNASMTSH